MAKTTIRGAVISDSKAIMDIWNPVIRDTLITFTNTQKCSADLQLMIAEKAAIDHPFLVAVHKDVVQGFATYGPFRNGTGYVHTMENSIMLAKTAQGRGVGRMLLNALVDHARSHDIHSLIAGISGENKGAIGFHHHCGFIEIARIPEVGYKFDRWLDLILMQKYL